jgi:hypothetical protein
MQRDDADHGDADTAARRQFLRALGGVGVAGLAGCAGDDGTDTPTTTPDETTEPAGGTDPATATPTDTSTPTPTDTSTPPPTDTSTPGNTFGDEPRPLVALAGDESASPDETVTLTGDLLNAYLFPVRSVEITLEPPGDGWEITATGATSFGELPSQGREEVAWEVVVPEDADGEYTIDGTITYETDADEAEVGISHTLLVLTPGEAPEEGLEAYVAFDGDTPTNEVTGADAEVYGDPSPGAAGPTGDTGDAFAFDGDGDAVASAEPLAIDGDAATIAGWVRFTGESIEEYTRLFTVAPDPTTPFDGANGYQVFYQAGGLWLVGFDASGESAVVTESLGEFIEPETWYFVAFTIDEGTYTMHAYDTGGAISGFPREVSASPRNKSESQHLVLSAGTDDFGTTYYAACRMDEVRAYSRPLSQGEMYQLYTGSGGSG